MVRRTLLGLVFLLIAGPLSAQVLEACVNKGNGMMRLVGASTPCLPNETRVQWNAAGSPGPAGPAGPAGPEGPAGPAGTDASNGPPYVWVCTPVNFKNAGSTQGFLHVFNGSASTANISAQWLNAAGTNIAGVTVPGAVPPSPGDPAPVYPGHTGSATSPVPPGGSFIQEWSTATSPNLSAADVGIAIRVTSDQPIVVGTNMVWSGFQLVPCNALHP